MTKLKIMMLIISPKSILFVRVKKLFFRNKTFLFFKMDSWSFQLLFDLGVLETRQNFKNYFYLSVLNVRTSDDRVTHVMIRSRDGKYDIGEKGDRFDTLTDLIEHYKKVSFKIIKFMFSVKVTIIDEIFSVSLTLCS